MSSAGDTTAYRRSRAIVCDNLCSGGAVGPAGPQGEVGPTGAPGTATNTGATGPTGVAGSMGPSGPTGPSGPQGIAGSIGATAVGSYYTLSSISVSGPPPLAPAIIPIQQFNAQLM
jgi:hypothetical protein